MSDDQFWRIVIGGAIVAAIPYIWRRDKSPTQQPEQAASEDRSSSGAYTLGKWLGKLWPSRK